jgi:ATP-dependent RNA helicase RhlB
MQFTDLALDDRLVRALAGNGIETCTRVQEETLVHSLNGRDVTVQSQTGTGKTIAFLVTSFQRSLGGNGALGRTLVVAPTRELAVQIHKEAELVGRHMPHRIGCFYGGVGYGEQERLLREGVDVVIGTPGRLLDYAGSGRIDFRSFAMIVIDEADRLFDMGFIPDLRRMMRSARPPAERQTMLFSATLGERVKQLAWEYMNEPVSVEIEPDVVTVREVTQVLYHVGKDDKMRLLLGLYRAEQPQRALIFTNTKHAAEMVARRMEANGHPSRYIMGDLPQSKRLSLIGDMKAGRLPVLVATDVAARGLHIDGVDLVVNYDLPEDRESYVHRIGRTARAGKSGKAVSLVCERYVYGLAGIEAFINAKIPVGQVTPDLLPVDATAGMGARPPRRSEGRGQTRSPVRRSGSPPPAPPARAYAEDRHERRPAPRGATRPRVDRNTPIEERAAYYRSKHDAAPGGGASLPAEGASPRPAGGEGRRRPATDAAREGAPAAGAGAGAGGRRRRRRRSRPAPTPATAHEKAPGVGRASAPKAEPVAEPKRAPTLLDRIVGLFRRRPENGQST